MARNRKHQTAAIRFAPALRAILLCVLIGGSGLGYVWQKGQIALLGRQTKEREERLKKQVKSNLDLSRTLESMKTVAWIEGRVKELNLGLVPQAPSQVLILVEPVPKAAAAPGNPQYAAGRNASPPVP